MNSEEILKKYIEVENEISLIENKIEYYSDNKNYSMCNKYKEKYNAKIDLLNKLQNDYEKQFRLENIFNK